SDVGSDYGSLFIPLYGHDLKQYFSLWESLSDPAHYSLNFVFGERSRQVPEPSVLLLMFIAMVGFVGKSLYRR
ncbi:MAG TPA: PEP-CTERM sorting domain-containing protein, partial [Cellvibrio sp.]